MATDTGSNTVLETVREYAALGWHVVPLHRPNSHSGCSCGREECEAVGKHPRISKWQEKATTDETQLEAWFARWPESNVGIQLGPKSNLVDIETDSPEEEAELVRLFGGDPPATCVFQADRGKHWLFRWREDLPAGAVIYIGKLGIRVGNNQKGAQSVFPPSLHRSGKIYRWTVHPDEVPPAPLPDGVVTKLWNLSGEPGALEDKPERRAKKWESLFTDSSVPEGVRDDTLLSFACREAGRSPNIDAPQEQADLFAKLRWANAAMCKPPLDELDLRRIHQQAIHYVRKDRGDPKGQDVGLTVHGLRYENGLWLPGEWRLTIVLSDPPEYRLHVPRWKQLTQDGGGTLTLSIEEYNDPAAVARAAQRATKGVVILDDVPRVWPAIWNGLPGNRKDGVAPRRGLRAILVDIATHEAAPPTSKRYVVVAEIFQELLEDAKPAPEGKPGPNPRRPTILPDGTIWIRWRDIWSERLRFREVDRGEPAELARRLGISEDDYAFFPASGHGRKRFCVLKERHLQALTALISERHEDSAQNTTPLCGSQETRTPETSFDVARMRATPCGARAKEAQTDDKLTAPGF